MKTIDVGRSTWRGLLFSASVAAACLTPGNARAAVERQGDFSDLPAIDLDVTDVSRAEALRLLAREAGLSLVVDEPPTGRIDLALADVPFDKVLDAILEGGDYVVRRDGSLVHVSPRRAGPVPSGSASGVVVKDGSDLTVMGQRAVVGPDEVVDDVTVMGGSIEIEGHVTGDLSVMGGSATLKKGARVDGDALAMGGVLTVEPGVEIDGDLGVLGGVLRGQENAKVKGKVNAVGTDSEGQGNRSLAERFTNATLLFFLGVIFFALAMPRMEAVRVEVAARPMRSLALGIVGPLLALLAIIGASITVIGIPFAALGTVLAVILAMAGTTAALGVIGKMVYGHRSQNPYVQLAIGCALFLVVGLIPVLGGLVQVVTVLVGIGAVVSTRAGGLLGARRNPPAGLHPYR